MEPLAWIMIAIVVVVFVYLFAALLVPEMFS